LIEAVLQYSSTLAKKIHSQIIDWTTARYH
jgi:hypothetical protein